VLCSCWCENHSLIHLCRIADLSGTMLGPVAEAASPNPCTLIPSFHVIIRKLTSVDCVCDIRFLLKAKCLAVDAWSLSACRPNAKRGPKLSERKKGARTVSSFIGHRAKHLH
jgi:hypothetical protein